mgnify:FL=1|jgi:hypothetical protein
MGWSLEQQSALEQALESSKHPDSKSTSVEKKQFWENIASQVKSKTAEQCFERFKTVRKNLNSSKPNDTKAVKQWTPKEIEKFQVALRKHRTVAIPDRWGKIAEDMPGRTAGDCEHAYREIAKSIKTGQPLSIAKNVKLVDSNSATNVNK